MDKTPEPNKVTITPTPPAKVDLVLAHAERLKQHAMSFAGKKGYNPFLWIAKNLDPLVEAYKLDASKSTAILALKPTDPKV